MSNTSSELASNVLETCLKLRGASDFRKTMQEVIGDIRELCRAEHCCILLMDYYEKACIKLCESFASDSMIMQSQNVRLEGFYDMAIGWENLIGSSNCLIAKDIHDMEFVKERDPEWYDSLSNSQVRNIVLFPLKSGDELLGYIWALNFDAAQAPKIKEALELTTFVLGSEIANWLLLDRLKVLSSKDMLTCVLNRNEMNNRVEAMSRESKDSKRTVGVIFADLNGLKTVNDEFGHNAGDALLKDAAKAMEDVFPKDCIYRAGGDEFTVILLGVTDEELKGKAEELRQASKKYEHVVFAIGVCLEDDYTEVRQALKIADQRMYEDKKLFYEMHPELKKRL